MNFSFTSAAQLLAALQIAGVSAESIAELSGNLTQIRLKSGQLILQQGKVNTHLYYVLDGGFVCRYLGSDGEVERTINFYLNELHPLMACIDSYFTQAPTQCELRAIADSAVLAIPKKTLDNLLEKDPPLKRIFDTLLIKALTEENDLKLKIIALKPDSLYQYILKELPVVIQKVPSKYIAELMGISAEWLSKLKAKQKNTPRIS